MIHWNCSFHKLDEKPGPLLPGMGSYPVYNPETGQWLGMYPYPTPFFPPMYPAAMPYPSNYDVGPRGGYRGRYPRARGRRAYRGRLNSYGVDDRRNDEWYDHKRRRDYRKRYLFDVIKVVWHFVFIKCFHSADPVREPVTAEVVVDLIHHDQEVDRIHGIVAIEKVSIL